MRKEIIGAITLLGIILISGLGMSMPAPVFVHDLGSNQYYQAVLMDTQNVNRCTDTDRGFNPSTMGTLSYNSGNGTRYLHDEETPDVIKEFACGNDIEISDQSGGNWRHLPSNAFRFTFYPGGD